MLTTNLQQSPYLPRQRNFPNDDVQELGVVLDKTYIEIASKVNERTIGLFAVNFQIITGENWFLAGQPRKQQSLRQVYDFTTTASIDTGIAFAKINRFTRMYGQFTDGTNWYGLIGGSNVAIPGQISFYLSRVGTTYRINFLLGAGAPVLTLGDIILEWLSTTATNS